MFWNGLHDRMIRCVGFGVMVGSMIRDVFLEFKSCLQHRMIRRTVGQKRRSNDVVFAGAKEEKVLRTGWSDARRSNASDYLTVSTSAVRSSTDTQGYRVDRWSNALGQSTVGLSDALRRKRINGSKWLAQLGGLYIWVSPGHLKLAGVQRRPTHIQEHLQATLELKCSNP